eukprot:gene30463-39706_t
MSGDSLDENLWEGANEYDIVKKVKSDDEYESGGEEGVGLIGNDEDGVIDAKSEKRKRKLSILKEMKRAKAKPSAGVTSGNDSVDAYSHRSSEHVFQLTSSEMAIEVRKLIHACKKGSRPDDDNDSNNYNSVFSPENFFSPAADGSGSSASGGAVSKSVCPFVRTLTTGLQPSYKKALRIPDTAEHRGSPIVVIVCSSAVRATKIIKSLSTHKHIHCKIAKLFAKHIKIAEQIEMLAAETYPIAIGTPNRLTKLLGLGALHLQSTRLLIVDVTADVKNMTILNMNGVRDDLTSLLDTYIAKELQHIKIALVRDKRDVE